MTMTTRKLAAAASSALNAADPATNKENADGGRALRGATKSGAAAAMVTSFGVAKNTGNTTLDSNVSMKASSSKYRSAFIDITNAVGKGLADGKRSLGTLGVRKPANLKSSSHLSTSRRSTASTSSSILAGKQRKTRAAVAVGSSSRVAGGVGASSAVGRRSVKKAAVSALAATASELARLSWSKKPKKLRSVPTLSDLPSAVNGPATVVLAPSGAAGSSDKRPCSIVSCDVSVTSDLETDRLTADNDVCMREPDSNIADTDDVLAIAEAKSQQQHQQAVVLSSSAAATTVDDTVSGNTGKSLQTLSVASVPDGVADFDADTDDIYSVYMYASQVFAYYKQREHLFPAVPYLSSLQTDLTESMRSILVDWMVEVQESFELNHETLYTAVRLVDLYLGQVTVPRDTLQLVGATALFVSCKFDERLPPPLDDFLYICEDAYTRHEVIHTEMKMLQVVDFQLGLPISYRFLRRYARCCRLSMETLTLSRYILEMSLMEYSLISVPGSRLAVAALSLALLMKLPEQLNQLRSTIRHYSGYRLDEYRDDVIALNAMLHKPPNSHLKTIRAKYSHKVFFEVAKTPLLDAVNL